MSRTNQTQAQVRPVLLCRVQHPRARSSGCFLGEVESRTFPQGKKAAQEPRNKAHPAKGRAVPAVAHVGFATWGSCRAALSCRSRCISSCPRLGPPAGAWLPPPWSVGSGYQGQAELAACTQHHGQPLRGRAAPPRPYAMAVTVPRTGASRSPRRDTLFPAGEPRRSAAWQGLWMCLRQGAGK